MRTFKIWCLLAIIAVGAGAAVASADDEAELRRIKTELWPRAYREQDTGLLGELLHESFQLIDAEGKRSSRADELEWVSANAWDPGEFEYRIERLDIYDGQVAIVSGQGVASAYTYRSSNVLIKQDGRWQAVSSHVSGFRAY